MSEKKNPVVRLAAWLVEHDQAERARLIEEMERRKQAGEDPSGEWPGWRQFAVYFADRYPYTTLFAPVAVVLYVVSIYQMMGG